MRTTVHAKLEIGRVREGRWASDRHDGLMGAFVITGPKGAQLKILSSGPDDPEHAWEHVSVSLDHRTPNWAEMCFVKALFWGDEETVVQYHPRLSDYVNCHPNTLHLWKPVGSDLPVPPSILVGPK